MRVAHQARAAARKVRARTDRPRSLRRYGIAQPSLQGRVVGREYSPIARSIAEPAPAAVRGQARCSARAECLRPVALALHLDRLVRIPKPEHRTATRPPYHSPPLD